MSFCIFIVFSIAHEREKETECESAWQSLRDIHTPMYTCHEAWTLTWWSKSGVFFVVSVVFWKYNEKPGLNKREPGAQVKFRLSLESSATLSHTSIQFYFRLLFLIFRLNFISQNIKSISPRIWCIQTENAVTSIHRLKTH